MTAHTAGILIIGNEILTGKVQDENIAFLTRRFFELGVEVRFVQVLPDEVGVIAKAVAEASSSCSYVITTGGMGPTHDDVTLVAVAEAFDRPMVHSPSLEMVLEKQYGFAAGPGLAAMARIPEGARLLHPEGARYPQLVMENVYLFPGVPDVAQRKFDLIASEFVQSPFFSRQVHLDRPEVEIVGWLNEAVEAYPAVKFGSYPKYGPEGESVLLTLDCRDQSVLSQAHAFLSGLVVSRP